jgi:sterol desaturase/sphingolipid hydroxylase (fatty acid hydroxylase superfamily)
LAVGAPAAAVLAFEMVLNATSMFSHGNLRLPRAADRALRFAVVTPEMHRVHHSTIEQETNSNFGFNLSLWDRLFGTYRAEAMGDPATMAIGLPSYRDASPTRIVWSLSFPFARGAAA